MAFQSPEKKKPDVAATTPKSPAEKAPPVSGYQPVELVEARLNPGATEWFETKANNSGPGHHVSTLAMKAGLVRLVEEDFPRLAHMHNQTAAEAAAAVETLQRDWETRDAEWKLYAGYQESIIQQYKETALKQEVTIEIMRRKLAMISHMASDAGTSQPSKPYDPRPARFFKSNKLQFGENKPVADAKAQLAKRIQDENFVSEDAGGDGNCFYLSIAAAAPKLGMNYSDVKLNAILYLVEAPFKYLSEFVFGSVPDLAGKLRGTEDHDRALWKKYVYSHYARAGEWADDLIVTATALALGLNIRLIHSGGRGFDRVIEGGTPGAPPDVVLGYIDQLHYVPCFTREAFAARQAARAGGVSSAAAGAPSSAADLPASAPEASASAAEAPTTVKQEPVKQEQ